MKRFYLIICFLMSIIGSAWGQETVSETVEITPGKATFVSKNNYSYTTENLSVALYVEINTDKKNPNGVTYDNFKFNNEKTCTITVTENATISKVEFYGISDNKGNIALEDGTALTKRDDLSDEEKSLFYYITTYDNTQSGAKILVFNRYDDNNCYIQKIKVTYTYAPVAATGISLNQTTAVLPVDETLTLNATVEPADATTETTWTTSDASVATVENGVVTALKAGVVTITATNNGLSATCTVVVSAVLSVGTKEKTATVANITSFNKCVITKSGQLMDCAQNGSYVIFQVTPEVSGTYSFTSKIATPQTGETVELFCGNTSLGVKNITPSGKDDDWSTGEEYTWTCTLEQGNTYDIKVVCAHDGEAYYTANVFNMNIVKMVYPWTVSGNTLKIEPSKVDGNIDDGKPKGLLVSGGMSTADDSMDDIPGLSVTLTGDASDQWQIYGNAYGKKNPSLSNSIPQNGTYIVLEPSQSGTVTIMTQALNGSSYYLVDSNGVQVGDAYSHNSADAAYEFTRELTAGNTYYYYIKGSSTGANLGFSSITYELVKYTTYVKVADFNYDRGPTGLANNNRDIDRTVGGFVFDFDKPSYQGIKINDVTKLDFQTTDSGSGMLNISLDNNNKDNVISKIVITGANLDQCSVENGTIVVLDDKTSATITVTDGTQPVVIQGGGFSVTRFDITTDFKPVFEKIKPVITLGAESIDVVINEHNATNALKTWNDKSTLDGLLSVDQSFFALTYAITDNGTGSKVYNDYSKEYEESGKKYRYLQGTVEAGAVMGSETVTVSFAENDYYESVSVTFNVNVISLSLTNGHTWDFQTTTTVEANDAAIENGVYAGCTEASGLLFTASAGSVEKKDGYLSLDKNGKAVVTIPGLKAGQIVTFNVESESNLTEHGIVCTSGNAELKSGVKSNLQGYFSFVVTEDGEVTFAESDGNGAMKIYSITVSEESPGAHPEVKFLDENGNEITNRPVQWYHEDNESGEHLNNHYTLRTSTKFNVPVNYQIIEGSEIATIEGDQVVFKGTGHVVVRAYIAGSTGADGNDAIMHLQHRKLATVTWTYNGTDFNNMTLEHNTGSELTDPTAATTATDATLAYRSSNTNVAVVDANGDITVTGAGETIITAYHASTEGYIGAYATFTLKVTGDISFYSTPNANLVTLGKKIGTMINKPNKAEGQEGWVILDKEEDVTIKYSAEGIVTAEFTEPGEMGGNGLLTVTSVDNNEFVGETVDVLLTVKMTKVEADKEDGKYVPLEDENGNPITAMYSTLYSVTIAPAGQLNFSWNEASGKMIVGDYIMMPEITGSANQNTNSKEYAILNSNESSWKFYGLGFPDYEIITDGIDNPGEATILYSKYPGGNDYFNRTQGLFIYAQKAGKVIVRAKDTQTNLTTDYELTIVEPESYNVAEKITFPYTWDFTGPIDEETIEALETDNNYWYKSAQGDYRNGYGYITFKPGNEDGSNGSGKQFKNFTSDGKLITQMKGLKVIPGSSNWASMHTRFVFRPNARENESNFGFGGTVQILLPTNVNTMPEPEKYRYFVKMRAYSSTKFEVFNAAEVTMSDGTVVSGEKKDFSNGDYIFCIKPNSDKSKELSIKGDNFDIYWIAASTEETHSTTVNGYPEGDSRRTAMATYTYGKALDYSLSKEVNSGLRTYIASEISKTGKKLNVKLTETTDALCEGEGVILRSDNAQAFYMIADAENEKEYTAPEYRVDNYLVGTVDDTKIYREDQAEANAVNYILSLKYTTENLGGVHQKVKDFGFYKLYSASITSKAKRSYLQVPFGDKGYGQAGVNPEEGASAVALGIIFEDEFGEVTGIIEVETDNSANANSKADGYYNLSGVRINKPTQKGVYIHNGKKIVVK